MPIFCEKTGHFKGLYHVLHGVLSPVDGITAEQLKLDALFKRVDNNLDVKDVINAFREWASDAPFLFGLDAQKSIDQCLKREIQTTKID